MTTLEITATYVDERIRFPNGSGDLVIGLVDHVDRDRQIICPSGTVSFSVKGPEDESRPLTRHRTYRFYGKWSKYKNKRTGKTEDQFAFSTYVEAEPASRAGIIAYLKEAGRGNGLGQATAAKVWERFGSDSVRILREQPDVVAAAVPRFSVESARLVASILEERKQIEHCSIALMGLLEKRGFPKTTHRRALALWGNQAAELIERNPYLLMQFRGCGFLGTDKFYLELGLPPGRLKRQALCAWYALASDTSGHTWYPRGVAAKGICESIAGAVPRPEEAIALAVRAHMLDEIQVDRTTGRICDNGQNYLAETKAAQNERYIARQIADAADEVNMWPIADSVEGISTHQAIELNIALQSTIGVFGGGPGCGKTYVAAALIKCICEDEDSNQVAVAAPTGKAAVRITEALQGYGINKRAKTIHSLLGVETSENGWKFKHDENNPLEIRYLIADEASMIDTDLMSSLLAARGRGTHILFVGDVNQLPPVGHGAPLRDFIRVGLPYGELTEIKRNDGGIVQACVEIRNDRPFKCDGNLQVRMAIRPQDQILHAIDICREAKSAGLDPIWDVQIVVPVNRKSEVSRYALNQVLQEELNHNPGMLGSPFRVGDKIVNTQNGFYPAAAETGDEDAQTNERGEVYVANGELAEVIVVEQKYTDAILSSPRRVIRIPRGQSGDKSNENDDKTSTGCAWDLGYALSVHKSQGSEWPWVVVIIDEYPGARNVCSREWVYTAISRAKSQCYLVGKLETAYRFCRRQQIGERKTFLVETIRREQSLKMLAEI